MKPIAVIPAAGLGTRLRPLTDNTPKELLLVGDKPLIAYAVEEAIQSGIQEICVIIREGKESIRRFFDSEGAWIRSLKERSSRVPSFEFVYQKAPKGLGDALLQAKPIAANRPFVMILPDQVFMGESSSVSQLMEQWEDKDDIVCSLIEVPRALRNMYPGSAIHRGVPPVSRSRIRLDSSDLYGTSQPIQENLIHFGRTIFCSGSFDFFGSDFANPETGEVDLYRTFLELFQHYQVFASLLCGRGFDLGTLDSYEFFRKEIENKT